jgi:hypothetical protein
MEQTSQSTITKFFKSPKAAKTNVLIEFVEEQPEKSKMDYKTMKEPFKTNEFIPMYLTSSIINHHFGSEAEVIHAFADNHLLLKIKIGDILNAQINNWSYNRPPDMARCPDIARYMYNSKKPIDTMIYLTYKNQTDTFEVLDGIHRLTALKFI